VLHIPNDYQDRLLAEITEDVQIAGLRNILCRMHVHVEVPEREARVPILFEVISTSGTAEYDPGTAAS
jgi:gamma-glutamyl:cysteine ligase YbdK (ATP-grasp superfamily)